MIRFLPVRCLLPLALAPMAACCQWTTTDPSPEELTRLYVLNAEAKQDETSNFTFLIHAHHITYIRGKSTDDHTTDSEQVFIGGQPYVRRLARNGKPLAGKDLKHENEMYDKAVEERSGLTELDRMKATKQKTAAITFLPIRNFVSDFRQEIQGHEQVDGHDCTILDLSPLHPDGPATLQLHLRLSLETKTLDVVQYRVEVLGQAGNFAKGTTFEQRNSYLDNVWLPVFYQIDALVLADGSTTVHFLDRDDFTNYRRFTVTSTLHELPQTSPPPE